jgi:hypothetical protein
MRQPALFNQPRSMYVDPRSVQISNTLKERYAANFQAADELDAQLSLLKVADFQGDMSMKKELLQSTRSQLELLSERGDYENLSLPVAKTAADFRRKYIPLEENFNKYQAYMKKVEDMYANGDIDAETYRSAADMSKHGYTGLQVDQDGNIDPKSYFSGVSLVKDVEIFPLVEESIKGIVAEEFGSQAQYLGQGPDGRFKVSTSEGVTFVSADRVQAIYQEVLARPDVQAALSQKAKLRTYNLDGTQIQNTIGTDIEMYQEELAKGQTLLDTAGLKPAEAVQVQKTMDQIQGEIDRLTSLGDSQQREYIQNREIQGILRPIETAVLAKNVWEQRPASENYTRYDYDEIYKMILDDSLQRSRAAAANKTVPVAIDAAGNVVVNQEADPNSAIASLNASLQAAKEYEKIAAEQNLSSEALRINEEARIAQYINYDLEQERLLGAALAAGVNVPLAANGRPQNTSWWANLSPNELSRIEDVFKDEESPYYWQKPVNLSVQVSDNETFALFKQEVIKAFANYPQLATQILNKDGEFKEGTLSNLEGKKITNLGITRAPYRNYGVTDQIVITYEDGTVAMVDASKVSSPVLDEIQSSPVFKMNSLTQAVSLNPRFNSSNPYVLATTFKLANESGVEEKKHIQIRIYPADRVTDKTYKLEDTRYEVVRDGNVSPKMTPAELANDLQSTPLGTIIL